MDNVFAFLRENKRITAISVAIVALLVAFGFDSSRVEALVAAFAGLAAALFASNSDTKSAVDQVIDNAVDREINRGVKKP